MNDAYSILKCVSYGLILASIASEREDGRALSSCGGNICLNIEVGFQQGVFGHKLHLGIFVGQAYRFVVIHVDDVVFGNLIQVLPYID